MARGSGLRPPQKVERGEVSSTRFRVGLALCLATLVAGIPVGLAAGAEGIQPVAAVFSQDSTVPVAEGTNRWFVQLKSPPAVRGTSEAALNSEKQAFRAAAAEAGVEYTERLAFNRLWNGLSVEVGGKKDVSTLSRLPGVTAVFPVLTVAAPRTETINPDLATAINMTGASEAQDNGWTGEGVKVAVMDSGLDYDHADLGGDGVNRSDSSVFPTARVIAGHDFVGDAFNADESSPAFNPTPAPDPRPDDCGGHGTHVSGIVGANPAADGGAKGVAPDVKFGAYRVFGCAGSTTTDIMIAAMERVHADGMQVLNMSIGSAFSNWSGYPTAAASDALVDQGVIVVASIGNSGANGVWSAGAPGVGEKVIGVASYDNSHVALPVFTITPDGTPIGYSQAAGAPAAPTAGSQPMARTGTQTTLNDACSALPAESLTGRVVLIRRGTCAFYIKAFNAQTAGAAGVVIYNNVPGIQNITVDPNAPGNPGGPPITVPVVSVSQAHGNLIDSRLATGPVTMTWTTNTGSFPNPTGGIISTFSSFGTEAELQVKPDIGAPGGLIRSTYPLHLGAYAIVSGTSMSSPHVAGAVAQLLEAKPGTSAATVRALLQNSADPRPFSAGSAFLDNVHRQGAGMLDIDDSITAPGLVTPSKITLGEAGPALVQTLTLTNTTSAAITYDLSRQTALGTFGSTFAPTLAGGAANSAVTFSAPSVMVPANGTATVDVTLTRPDFGAANKLVYGGWLVLTPQGAGQVLRVPYAGFGGDYQGFPVMNVPGSTFPKLAKRVGFVAASNFTPTYAFPTGAVTYNLQKTNVFGRHVTDAPTVAVHLDHQVRWLTVTVLTPAGSPVNSDNTGATVNAVAFRQDYMARNSTSGGFFAIEWDGRLTRTLPNGKTQQWAVPDGDYRFKVDVLKPLGDVGTAGHTETYTSPVFTIDRP